MRRAVSKSVLRPVLAQAVEVDVPWPGPALLARKLTPDIELEKLGDLLERARRRAPPCAPPEAIAI